VNEVVAEARISRSLLLPEEIDYIRDQVLKKPLRVIHIWALGVGVVITGGLFFSAAARLRTKAFQKKL
jgi:hypothetical protein